jgi:ArsR family transcriptional regulator, arsenate/arsenite/antimonite-responsive transcriptional repressor
MEVDKLVRVKSLPIVECCTPLAGSTLSADEAVELERLFKALGDRHRLRILNVLLQADGEAVCVCEFQPTLGIAQPTVSHHLKQLVEAGLLEREKRGTFAYYCLKPGVLGRIGGLLVEPSAAVSV